MSSIDYEEEEAEAAMLRDFLTPDDSGLFFEQRHVPWARMRMRATPAEVRVEIATRLRTLKWKSEDGGTYRLKPDGPLEIRRGKRFVRHHSTT